MPGNVLYPVSPYPHINPNANPFGNDGGVQGGGGGLLAAMFPPQMNQPQVNTGTDAQGNPTFDVTPASIGGGFMNRLVAGRQGQMQVNNINAQLQEERLRQLGGLAQEREVGKQQRAGKITDAQIVMLQSMGLMPRTTPDGSQISADLINSVAAKTEQPNLDIAGLQSQNKLAATQSPQGQNAMTQANLATMLGPAIAAQKASQVQAGPGETVAYQPAGNIMQQQPDILSGATSQQQQFTPVMNPMFGKPGYEGQPMYSPMMTGVSSMQPGSLKQPIDPAILQAAAQQQQGQGQGGVVGGGLNINPTAVTTQPGMAPPSNIPTQPSPTPGLFTGGGPLDIMSWLQRQFSQQGVNNNIGNSSTPMTGY